MSPDVLNKPVSLFAKATNLLMARLTHTDKTDSVNSKKRYLKSGLDDKKIDEYESRLIQFIETTKIFLDPELSLEELSVKVNIAKHHITELLNDRVRKNFYTFINEYRIREAAELLKDAKGENLMSLAFDCGFNTKSSFNSHFKKVMAETPSSYRKRFLTRKENQTN